LDRKNIEVNPLLETYGKYIKNIPLFIYAENLLYNGMKQFIYNYNGGLYKFIQLTDSENLNNKNTFIPVINNNDTVTITSPFGESAQISTKAATLVVWLFVVEQIANTIEDHAISQRLFKTLQDIQSTYSLMLLNDKQYFSDNDLKGIFKLID